MPSIFFQSTSSVSVSRPEISRRRRRATAAYHQRPSSWNDTIIAATTTKGDSDCSSNKCSAVTSNSHTTMMMMDAALDEQGDCYNSPCTTACCMDDEMLFRSVSSEQSVQNAVAEININMEGGCVRSQKLFYKRHETSKILEYKVMKIHERLHYCCGGEETNATPLENDAAVDAVDDKSSSSNNADSIMQHRSAEIMTFVQPVLKPSSPPSSKSTMSALRSLELGSGSNHSTSSQGIMPRNKSAADLSFVLCDSQGMSRSLDATLSDNNRNGGGDENDVSLGNNQMSPLRVVRGERWGYFVAPIEVDSPVKLKRRAIF